MATEAQALLEARLTAQKEAGQHLTLAASKLSTRVKLEISSNLRYNCTMAAKKKATTKKGKKTTTVARTKDGSVQMTFVIDWKDIETNREKVSTELAKTIEVPGFRKGKAPVSEAKKKIPSEMLMEKTLARILPQMFADAVKKNKINPAMYPKFELKHAHEGEDWEVTAKTAEFPEFSLGDYKKVVKDAAKTSEIWTPDKGDAKAEAEKKELSSEQKENIAIEAIAKHYKFVIPEILIDEEVNSRLASLMERLEKLGLSLESYLASIKKSAEELRNEYSQQAANAIRLDIILGKIAQEEKVSISDPEIEQFISAANASSPTQTVSEDQKDTIRVFLTKRKVIDSLSSLL